MPGSPNPIDDLPPGGAATCANAKKVLCQWRSFVSHGEVLCHMDKLCVTRKSFVSQRKFCVTSKSFVSHGKVMCHMEKVFVTWKQIEIYGNKKRCTLLLFFSPIPTKRCSAAIALHTNLYKSPAIGGCHSWSNIKENMNIYEKNSFPPLILGNSLLKMRLWEIVWALLGASMKADKKEGTW